MPQRKSIDTILSTIPGAIGRADWNEVMRLASEALEIDPNNQTAIGFMDLAQSQLADDHLSTDATSDSERAAASSSTDKQAVTEPLPESFVNGRYEGRQFLGEGARKKVYLAHDTVLDRDVAFALIKTDGLDADSSERVHREAQVMGRLGSHTNVVTVHDLGTDGDDQYVVMELMEGGDLAAALSSADEGRLETERVTSIGSAVCRGLAFAHEKGVIHRDIKPSNIWFSADGTVKIGDFGLALAADASRLTRENTILGTVTYLSPEQATGADVSPRSDLYSLGVVLYEMVTGRPPFMGDDEVAIISQHINTPPVAPSWHNGQCPRPLEALILRMLSKDPSARPGSADDVQAALEAIDLASPALSDGGIPGTTEGVGGARGNGISHALDSLAGGVFVGRVKEMGQLKAALEDALSGRGRLVTLVGEPGIGKTRTAEELRTYAGLRGTQVLWGRSHEEKGAPPYWPWIQAVRSYVRDHDAKRLKSELGSGSGVVAEVISDVRVRLPDVPTPVALDDPESSRFRLFDALSTFLKSASKTQPLVIVLDDLHWADSSSLAFLQFLARDLDDARMLVIGTYRDVEVRRTHPLQSTLAELTRERLFERVILRGLSKNDVARFVELASAIKPPAELVSAIYTHTEGNPLFVTEVVRLLVQRGDLTRGKTDSTKHWSLGIPEGVREVIGHRLDHLSERCNEVLTVAAAVGRNFGVDLLLRLIDDQSERRLIEILEEALFARMIDELPDAIGSYQFTHALVQQTLIEELTLTRRVRLHAQIAESLEALYGEAADEHATELVEHFAEAETVLGKEKVAHYSLLAGQEAENRFAWAEALEHYERGLEAKSDVEMDDEKAWLVVGAHLASTALQFVRSTLHTVYVDLLQVVEFFLADRRISDAVRVVKSFNAGTADEDGVHHDLAERVIEEVTPGTYDEAWLWALHSETYHGNDRTDGYAKAMRQLASAVEIARKENDKALEKRAIVARSRIHGSACEYEEAFESASLASSFAQQMNDPLSDVWCKWEASRSALILGKSRIARENAVALLAASEKLPALRQLAFTNNTNVASVTGEFAKARLFNSELIDLRDHWFGNWAFGARALIEAECGDMTAAEQFRSLGMAEHDALLAANDVWPVIGFLEFIAWLSRYTSSSEDIEAVERLANSIVAADFGVAGVSRNQQRNIRACADVCLATCAVIRDDAQQAASQLSIIESMPRHTHLPTSLIRLLGLLANTVGDTEKARAYFDESLEFNRNAEYWLYYVWTCHDYASLMVGSGTPDDLHRAKQLLADGLARAKTVGMKTAENWITKLQARLSEARSGSRGDASEKATPTYPDGLTDREVEVLRLVAKGFTNNEVADLLHISGRTVATHLRNVYEKTGCANRAEASAYAIRNGLAEE